MDKVFRKVTIRTETDGKQELWLTDRQVLCTSCNGTGPWNSCPVCKNKGYREVIPDD